MIRTTSVISLKEPWPVRLVHRYFASIETRRVKTVEDV
jgi:hypothetical protein